MTTTDISLWLLLGPQLQAFAAAGFEVIGISAPGPWVDQLGAVGVRHVPLRHATRRVAPFHDALAVPELFGVLRSLRPDIVHTHNPKPGVYGRLAGRAVGVSAVVNTVHGLYATPDDGMARRAVVYGVERLAATCSDVELVQNVEDLVTLRRLRIPAARLRLLGNGVDLARFRPGPRSDLARERTRESLGVGPSTVLVGAVGRMVWEKGYRELVEAAAALQRIATDVSVVVVGPAEPGKADAVSDADIVAAQASGVRFLGFRDDVEDIYASLDIYVLASHREGFPRSAMEAAAMGLPIVATDIRGCRQVVDDGRTGILVPVGDAMALARAVAELAADPARRRAMAQQARAKAEREFDQQRVIDATLAVYEELLAARSGRSRRTRAWWHGRSG